MTGTLGKCTQTAQCISRLLGAGISADASVMAYLQATTDADSLADISDLLGEDDSCERDTLLDLLFFPNQALQIALEPFLRQFDYSENDARRIAELLARQALEVPVTFPAGVLTVPLPDFAAASLISRLRLHRQIAPELARCLVDHLPPQAVDRVRVILRNAAVPDTDTVRNTLAAFFKQFPADDPHFEKGLDFLLSFLTDLPDTADVFQSLANRKRKLADQLQKTEKYLEQLQNSNMEIMMSQGRRQSGLDMAETRITLRVIDTIALRLFGRPAPLAYDFATQEVALPSRPEDIDVRKVLKMFS